MRRGSLGRGILLHGGGDGWGRREGFGGCRGAEEEREGGKSEEEKGWSEKEKGRRRSCRDGGRWRYLMMRWGCLCVCVATAYRAPNPNLLPRILYANARPPSPRPAPSCLINLSPADLACPLHPVLYLSLSLPPSPPRRPPNQSRGVVARLSLHRAFFCVIKMHVAPAVLISVLVGFPKQGPRA